MELEVDRSVAITAGGDLTGALQLKWDAAGDLSKRLGLSLQLAPHTESNNGRRMRLALEHPALEQDLVLSAGYATDGDLGLDARLELTYSPDEQHRLSAAAAVTSQTGDAISGVVLSLSHPATQTELHLNATVVADGGDWTLSARLDYQDRSRTARFVHGSTRYLAAAGLLRVQLATAEHTLTFSNSLERSSDTYALDARLLLDDAALSTLRGRLDAGPSSVVPYVQIDASGADGDTVYSFDAGMPDQRQLTLNLYRDIKGRTVTDGYLSVRLNDSNVLDARLNWRAASWTELRAAAFRSAVDAAAASDAALQHLVAFVVDEVGDKSDRVAPIAGSLYRRLCDYHDAETALLAADLTDAGAYLSQLYQRNDFYVRHLVAALQDMHLPYLRKMAANLVLLSDTLFGEASALYQAARGVAAGASRVAAVLYRQTSSFVAELLLHVGRSYGDMASVVGGGLERLDALLDDGLRRLRAFLDAYCGRVEETVLRQFDRLGAQIRQLGQSYADTLRPYVDQIKTWTADLSATFADLCLQIRGPRARRYIDEVLFLFSDPFSFDQQKLREPGRSS